MPSYIYRDHKDGTAIREEPAPDADDHSADALRYLCLFLDSNDWRATPEKDTTFAPGTFGAKLGHAEVLAESEDLHMWWADTDEEDAQDKRVARRLEDMW